MLSKEGRYETDEAPMNTLITHITFDQKIGIYTSTSRNQIMEIDVLAIPFSQNLENRQAKNIPGGHSTTL